MAIHRNDLGIMPRRPVALAAADDDPGVVVVGVDVNQAPAPLGGPVWPVVRPGEIRRDGGTQLRAGIDPAVVASYRALIADGDRDDAGRVAWPFRDPVEVMRDGATGDLWLVDGFQRLAAWGLHFGDSSLESVPPVPVLVREVEQDGQRAAVLAAAGANAHHGAPRTDADKRSAVDRLLADPEWAQWSDRELARRAGVSAPFVAGRRKAIAAKQNGAGVAAGLGHVVPAERKYTDRHGNDRTMDTSNIGAKAGDGAKLGRAISGATWGDRAKADQAAGILAHGKLGGAPAAPAQPSTPPAISKPGQSADDYLAYRDAEIAAGRPHLNIRDWRAWLDAGSPAPAAGGAVDGLAAVHDHLVALVDALPLLRREMADPASAALWQKLQAAVVPAVERVGAYLVAKE